MKVDLFGPSLQFAYNREPSTETLWQDFAHCPDGIFWLAGNFLGTH